jgi:beta-fructofuranosidase
MTNKVSKYEQLLARATQHMFTHSETCLEDSYSLAYHFRPLTGWINDPNGLIHYKGEYHLFYQYHPFTAKRGPMHWGHAKSKDLLKWEYLPVAMAPFEEYEKDGCYSGSAVELDGKLMLIYTGHVKQDGKRKEVQCIAESTDGVTFTKFKGNPVIPFSPDKQEDFRDPKVWKHGDHWYMVVGTGENGIGKALLYRSPDLYEWKYIGVAAESNGEQGHMWECPDLFPLGNKHVLIVSPKGMNNGKNIYIVGEMNYEQGKFIPEYYNEIDHGFDFYASQTFLEDKGRRIIIGWMGIWSDPDLPTKSHGWAGAMTLPRELTLLPDGKVSILPVQEVQQLRNEHYPFSNILISPQSSNILHDVKGDCLEILAEFDLESCNATEFGFKVRCSPDSKEQTRVVYHTATQELRVDRNQSGKGKPGISSVKLDYDTDKKLKIHIFVDRSSVEVFGNDGRVNISNRIYPDSTSVAIEAFSIGGEVRAESIQVWKLN